jgi:hypothetical protein
VWCQGLARLVVTCCPLILCIARNIDFFLAKRTDLGTSRPKQGSGV